MEIHYPRYENGLRWWNPLDEGWIIKETDYTINIATHEEFYDVILKDIDDIHILVKTFNQIQEKKMIDTLKRKQMELKSQINQLIKGMPTETKKLYKEKSNVLIALQNDKFHKIMNYLIENMNDTKIMIDKRIFEIKMKIKLARKNANRKYYLKQKELLNIQPVSEIGLTDEELKNMKLKKQKESRQKANRKYYLKGLTNI